MSATAGLALQEIGCATLFATHFHELTALTGEVGVKNLHVTSAIDEQSGSLTMLYQVGQLAVLLPHCTVARARPGR